MGSSPPGNNALTVIDDILNGLIISVGVEAAIVAATAQLPWLSLPIISGLFRWVVTNVAGKVFRAIKPYVDIQVIKFENDEEREAYTSAVAALKDAQLKGDEDAKQKALAAAKAALDKLISYKH